MTSCSESHQEAAGPTPLLTPRKPTRIATWNVRTMYEAGRTRQVAMEMKRYGIRVLGISETRWLQSGQIRLVTGEQLLSGHTMDGAPHTEGVGITLAPEAQRALIGWEPVSSRIITAKFTSKRKNINLHIIQCYAPTNDADDEKKDELYLKLQAIVEKASTKDMVMMMGDFNAKIGSNNTGYEDTMGTHGLGVMNDNGERFADLCANNQLVIGGSIFPQKRIHKATWISPDHVTENQIDHICISSEFRRAWQDVRVRRGADVPSDHHLLLTIVRLRLKKNITASNQRTKFNVGLLTDQSVQEKFSIDLYNRFQPLQELLENEETEIEHNWNHSKKLWLDTCEQILGKKKMQHKDWISESTILEIETRKAKKMVLNQSRTRTAKVKAQAEYNTANKRVKESIKKDKNDYVDSLASQAEEAAGQGNIKELYTLSKKLAGKYQKRISQSKIRTKMCLLQQGSK